MCYNRKLVGDFMKKINFNFKKNRLFCIIIGLLIISVITNIILLYKNNNKIEQVKVITDQNIVFFGDSITYGYNINEFFPNTNVINSGINGNRTSDLISRIDNDVYRYNPSKVIVLIGINDLAAGISQDDITNNIQTIINGIKLNRSYSKIYIESVYPINRNVFDSKGFTFNKDISNDTIKELNTKIESLCIENDVTYINVYDSLTDVDGNLKESYTKEGLHLTDLGYFKVTKVLENYIY